jgi:hypothetical protein
MRNIKRLAAVATATTLLFSPMTIAKAKEGPLKTMPLTEVLNLEGAAFDKNFRIGYGDATRSVACIYAF